MFCILFLKSQNKCRCFLLKCRVQSVCIAYYCSQPPKPRYCSVVPNIGEHCSSVPGWYCHSAPVVSVCWCVVMVCLVWGGGARPLTPGCSGSSSSPAAVCSVQQHGPARSTEQQGRIYSPAALHRHPPHPTGNTRSYEATRDTYTRYTLMHVET